MIRQYAPLAVMLATVAACFYIHHRNVVLREPLAFCVIAAALITFFWFLSRSKNDAASQLNDGVLRKAIAASIVVEYIVLVGTFAFWGDSTVAQLPPMTALLVPSFTSIVGIVIAFYFGASAYVEARGRSQGTNGKGGGSST